MSNLNSSEVGVNKHQHKVSANDKGVHPYTLVLTTKGVKELQDVTTEDKVYAYDKVNGNTGFVKVEGTMKKEVQETSLVELKYLGGSTLVNANQPVGTRTAAGVEWKPVKDVTDKDMLLFGVRKEEEFILDEEMWLTGVLTAVGILKHKDGNTDVSFFHSNSALMERVCEIVGIENADIIESTEVKGLFKIVLKTVPSSVLSNLSHLVATTEEEITVPPSIWLMNTNKKLSFLLGVIDANAFKQPTYNHVTFVRTSSQQFANELAFLGAMVGNKTNVFIPSIDLGEFSVIFEVNFSTCGWFEGFFLDYSLLEMHVNTCSNCDCEVTPEKFTKVQSVESQKTNSDIDSLHAIFTSGTYACLMTTQGAPIFI